MKSKTIIFSTLLCIIILCTACEHDLIGIRKKRLTGKWQCIESYYIDDVMPVGPHYDNCDSLTIEFNKDNTFTEIDVYQTGKVVYEGTWEFQKNRTLKLYYLNGAISSPEIEKLKKNKLELSWRMGSGYKSFIPAD